jgi:transcriptional regulator with XRE-family HTH domain
LKSLKPRLYEEAPSTLGGHLRKRRLELGLYQKDVASRLKVNGWTYLGWEQDRRRPPVRFWPGVISFLGYNPSPAAVTLAEQIRAKRRELGLTQEQAAKLIGIDEGTLMRYERGEWTPKGARLVRVIKFLGSINAHGS